MVENINMENNTNVRAKIMTDSNNNNKEATTMNNNTNINKEVTTMNNNNNNKGVTTMNNNNNKGVTTGRMATETETQVTNRETAMITVVTENTDAISQMIDEDERALSNESAIQIQNMLRMLDQSALLGMGQVKNVLNDALYARIYEDHKGFRNVEFCQRYIHNGLSPLMCISQDDLMTTAMYEYSTQPVNEPNRGVKRKISNFKAKVHKEYFGKFRGGFEDMLPVEEILFSLATALHMLPVYSDDNRALKRTEFYYQVIGQAKNCTSQVMGNFNSYYALTEEEIGYIAQDLKKDRISFLRELKDYGLLYLTDSSKGYQTNVRCKYDDGTSRTEWRYCIFKLSHLAGVEEEEEEGLDLNSF